jgi:prevent-host-death family protein
MYNYIKGVIFMLIKPSTALRNEYNTISALCKEKQEPIFLTKNGEGDLVLMSIEAYKYREEMLDLREKLLSAEANRLAGAKTYTIEQVSEKLRGLIDGNV